MKAWLSNKSTSIDLFTKQPPQAIINQTTAPSNNQSNNNKNLPSTYYQMQNYPHH